MLKKLLSGIGLIFLLSFLIYHFYIKDRYLNNLHTHINLNSFSNDMEGIEKMVDWYYHNYHIPSISVSIIEDGKVVKHIGRGQISKKLNKAVDENSYYQIASTSKTLTGIICKSLELDGKLDLDKSIADYFQDKLNESTYQKFKNVTLRQVINHTSGLGRSMYAYDEEKIIKALSEVDLEFEPGSKFQYSNFGYALISQILENVTNKTYAELLKEHISEKFELSDFKTKPEQIENGKLVTPYWKHFRLLEGETYDFGIQIGASGVFTNTKTLANLMVKQLNAYAAFDSLKAISPLILNYPKVESYNEKHFYGFGIFEFNYEIDEMQGVIHKNLEHGGDADGFSCIYDFFPEYNSGVVILTSSGGRWLNEVSRHINTIQIRQHYN